MPPFRAICRGLRCLCVSNLVANTPLRPCVSGANFWRLVLRELYSGSTDAERGALVGPIERYALQQPLDGQAARLAALDSPASNVISVIAPQSPSD
jgi:hypothetical protein